MKPMPMVLSLLVICTTQSACHSTRQVQESLLLIEQSKELPADISVDANTDDQEEGQEVSEKNNTIQE